MTNNSNHLITDPKFHQFLAFFVYALFAYSWFSANIVMPILPELTRIFHASATLVTLSVTSFLFGLAAFQLVWGPISDYMGRKQTLFLGFTVTIFGALVAAFSINIGMFIAARFVEAIGMACGTVMARSLLMDVFNLQQIVKAITFSASVSGIAPAIGPIIGSWLSVLVTWHSVLLFLALYGAIMLYLTYKKIPETNLQLYSSAKIVFAFKAYTQCLKNKIFSGSVILYALYFGIMFGFYTDAPFIFIERLKYSKTTYGWFIGIPVAAYILGAHLARKIIAKHTPTNCVKIGIYISLIGTFSLYLCYILIGMSSFTVIFSMAIFIIGSGLMSPALNTLAMTQFTVNRGAAAALIGGAMALGSAVLSGVVAILHATTLIPLLIMTTFVVIFSIIIYVITLHEQIK